MCEAENESGLLCVKRSPGVNWDTDRLGANSTMLDLLDVFLFTERFRRLLDQSVAVDTKYASREDDCLSRLGFHWSRNMELFGNIESGLTNGPL